MVKYQIPKPFKEARWLRHFAFFRIPEYNLLESFYQKIQINSNITAISKDYSNNCLQKIETEK